jgi:hypothetical protein
MKTKVSIEQTVFAFNLGIDPPKPFPPTPREKKKENNHRKNTQAVKAFYAAKEARK